jgi:hypothetical protein
VRAFSFVGLTVAVALLSDGANDAPAQVPAAPREWVDSSGQFKLKAVYVGRTDGGVVLRREDATEVTVPLERLSAADLEFLKTLEAPASRRRAAPLVPPVAGDGGGVESFVIVETRIGDKVVAYAGAVVAFVDGGRAYLSILSGAAGVYPEHPLAQGPEPQYAAIIGPQGQERRVELEGLRFARHLDRGISLSAPKDQLPPPLKLQRLPDVVEGQKLVSTGARIMNDEYQARYERVRLDTLATDVRKSSTGEVYGYTVKRAVSGVLSDEGGTVLGIYQDGASRSGVYPTLLLTAPFSLQLHALRIRETRPTPREVKLEFLMQTRDLHPTLHPRQSPRMLVSHLPESKKSLPDYQYRNDPDRFRIVDGKWAKTEDGLELDLQPIEKWDEEFDVPAPVSPKLNAAHWYASYSFSLDKRSGPVFYLPVAVDSAGSITGDFYSYDSHVKVPDQQPLPLLFRHPVGQYEQGTPIAPQAAGGGRLVTDDPPKVPGGNPGPAGIVYVGGWGESSLEAFPRIEFHKSDDTRPLVKEVRNHPGLATATLSLPIDPGPQPAPRPDVPPEFAAKMREDRRLIWQNVAPMVASADGKFLYLVDGRDGRDRCLRKIDTSTWSLKASLCGAGDCCSIALAQGGLLVNGEQSRLCLVDPLSLEIKKVWRPATPDNVEIAATPNSPYAYVLWDDALAVFDTIAGTVVKWVSPKRMESIKFTLMRGNHGPRATMSISPDGKYLFMANDRIHRFRCEGPDLVHEDAGPVDAPTCLRYRLSVSDDLRFAASSIPKMQGTSPADLPLYDPRNLSRVVTTLSLGPEPAAVAFDSPGGRIFAATRSRHVLQLDLTGNIVAECALGSTEDVRRILILPNHGAAVYWADDVVVVDTNIERLSTVPRAP